jgi:ribosomal 30S subunit maturation factor RimM
LLAVLLLLRVTTSAAPLYHHHHHKDEWVIGLANAAREAEATARRQELTSTEEKFMRSLRDHFHIVDIPGIDLSYHPMPYASFL